METAKISKSGRITIPKGVRKAMGLKPGDAIDFVVVKGYAVIRGPKRKKLLRCEGF